MIVEGSHVFSGAREVVWALLLDPQVIARSMPGTETLVQVTPDRYEGKMRVGLGAITLVELDLAVTLADAVVPERYTLLIDGTGRLGFARGAASVRLDANGAGTVMHYKADLALGGRIAAVGEAVLGSVSRAVTRQGFAALAQEVAARLAHAPPPSPPSSPPAAPPAPPAPPAGPAPPLSR